MNYFDTSQLGGKFQSIEQSSTYVDLQSNLPNKIRSKTSQHSITLATSSYKNSTHRITTVRSISCHSQLPTSRRMGISSCNSCTKFYLVKSCNTIQRINARININVSFQRKIKEMIRKTKQTMRTKTVLRPIASAVAAMMRTMSQLHQVMMVHQ